VSWYNSDWTYRAPIVVNNHASAGTSADVTIALPSEWPEFWDNVQADGDDVRVTDADGYTLETYDVESWNSTTRTGTIEIDGMGTTDLDGNAATAGVVAWLYWGNSTASNAETTFTPNSPKTGTVVVGIPGLSSQRVVTCRPEAPGATNPRLEISKISGEEIYLWWDLSGVLTRRRMPSQGSRAFEEIHNVTYRVDDGGSAQAGMIDTGAIRVAAPAMVRTKIKAGSSGSTYVAVLLVELTEGRKLEFRCTIRVQDPVEP